MKGRPFFFLFATIAVFCLSAHAEERSELSADELSRLAPIAEGIRRASSFTLYEGLPHPVWDR